MERQGSALIWETILSCNKGRGIASNVTKVEALHRIECRHCIELNYLSCNKGRGIASNVTKVEALHRIECRHCIELNYLSCNKGRGIASNCTNSGILTPLIPALVVKS
jgi:hypothetical protein